MKKIVYRQGDTITIVTLNSTSNKKIASPGEKIVQTYHFSREQYEIAQGKTSMKEFFSHDGKVCFDCPFAVSNGAKLSACYTHKMMQYSGFLSSLRSIGKLMQFDDIPEYSTQIGAASTHTEDEERVATLIGYRSFVASPTPISKFISCPASEEMGFKSNCSKCGLCSGTQGKGKKSVIILEH